LWKKGILGKGSAFSLQFTIWYHMTLCMGLRGRDEHRRVKFGDVVIKSDARDISYIELLDRGAKTRDGALNADTRATTQKIFCSCSSTGEDRCVVEIFRELIKRRPADFCQPEHPLYLQYKTDKQLESSGSSVWFKREPLGVGSLGKFLPKACVLADLAPRGNHGVRATAVQRLREAKVPDDKIIQVTGHKSVRTLAIYDTDQLRPNEHKDIQSILQGSSDTSKDASATTSSTPVTMGDDNVNPNINSVANSNPNVPTYDIIPRLPVAVTTSAPMPLATFQGMQNQVISNSSGNPQSIFAGSLISHCTFHIHNHSAGGANNVE
jgi:hypothetical protein